MSAKNRVAFIFLLLLTAGLTLFIGLQLIKYYKETKGYSDATFNPSIKCTGYIYSISSMRYDGKTLSFVLTNQPYSDYGISSMTLATNKTYNVNITIPQGVSREVAIKTEELPENFNLYPENCLTHAKICSKTSMSCN